MTDPTEQELAEYWRNKLEITQKPIPHVFFHNPVTASFIAHLIQEYMEGEGFQWEMYCPSISRYQYRYQRRGGPWCEHIFESKWIANAEAARKALEGE